MTFTLSMQMLAVIALLAGVVAFFVPRLLGYMAGVALVAFAFWQLFPEAWNDDLRQALNDFDLSGISADTTPNTERTPGSPG